jgi:hypothetical protein
MSENGISRHNQKLLSDSISCIMARTYRLYMSDVECVITLCMDGYSVARGSYNAALGDNDMGRF